MYVTLRFLLTVWNININSLMIILLFLVLSDRWLHLLLVIFNDLFQFLQWKLTDLPKIIQILFSALLIVIFILEIAHYIICIFLTLLRFLRLLLLFLFLHLADYYVVQLVVHSQRRGIVILEQGGVDSYRMIVLDLKDLLVYSWSFGD